MQTFFEDFTIDDGHKVTVEWGWSRSEECVLVESVWETETERAIDLTDAESERFDAQVLALDPFPPDEPLEDYIWTGGYEEDVDVPDVKAWMPLPPPPSA